MRWLRDPERAIAAGPPPHHLRIWDRISAGRRVPAVGGLDGHQPGIRFRGRVRSPLTHDSTFRFLRTHLLCERPLGAGLEPDRDAVLAALREGRAWLACEHVAPAQGARLWAERDDGSIVQMGGEAPAGRAVLRVRLPRAAQFRVLRDGAAIAEHEGAELDLEIGPAGAHRLEARIDGRLWLLSNQIHLR